jgi:hypothetical protein
MISIKDYIKGAIPYISSLMLPSSDVLFKGFEVIVIGNRSDEIGEIFPTVVTAQIVYDFVRIVGRFKNGDNSIAII